MTPKDEESWLEHARWVRALARDVMRDAQQAEDVTQDAMVAAWRGGWTPTEDPVGLRRWLAATVRNLARMTRRSDSNRRAREAEVAATRAGSSDSTGPIDARIAVQQRVAEAVAALPPEDREVVVLRYFDGLQPREIAERLSSTPNAVSSRLSRARARLRGVLDETSSDDAALGSWVLVALGLDATRIPPSTGAAVPLSTPLTIPSGLTWTLSLAMKKLAVAAAILLSMALLGGLWLAGDDDVPGARQATAPGHDSADTRDLVPNLVELSAPDTEVDRSLVAASVEAPEVVEPETVDPGPSMGGTGAVLVRVISDDTGIPISEVGVSVMNFTGSRWHDSPTGPTDQRGEKLFRDLPEGKARVSAWRSGTDGDSEAEATAEIQAGETVEVTLRLGGGATMIGRVVDELDRGVARAEIWVSRGNGLPTTSLLAGYTDSQGRFKVRHTMKLQAVGARAPGTEPSVQRMPQVIKPADPAKGVTLLLKGQGGSMKGRVLATTGEPVPSALVKVERLGPPAAGHPIKLEKGFVHAPASLLLRTDEQGRFSTQTMGSGPFLVTARGRATDLVSRQVEVASGGSAEVELVVGEPGSLTGVVTDHLGAPVAGAHVSAYGMDWDFCSADTVTDEAGAFHFSALASGSLEIEVTVGRAEGGVKEAVLILNGQQTVWNPVLPAPLAILGRALSTSGSPLAGFHIRGATKEGSGPMAQFQVDVQPDGTFTAPNCLDAAYDLSLQLPGQWMGDALITLEGIGAGTVNTEFVLDDSRLPGASLKGAVLNAEGQALPFRLQLEGRSPLVLIMRHFTQPEGTFEIPHLPAGDYEATFSAEGYVSKRLELASPLREDEARELPEVRLTRQ